MVFNLGYGLVCLVISTAELSFYIGIAGVCNIIFGITKLHSLKKCNSLTYEAQNTCSRNIAVLAGVTTFLHFSVAVVCLFFYENPANYGFYTVIFIAGSAFIKTALAGINSARTRKNRNKIIRYIKLTDAANALISLGLTQRAVLYYTGYGYANIVSGIGGIFFSLCALSICLMMIAKSVKKEESSKGLSCRGKTNK